MRTASGSMGERRVDFQQVLFGFILEGNFLTQSWTNCVCWSALGLLKEK